MSLLQGIKAEGITSDFTTMASSTGWMSFQVALPWQKQAEPDVGAMTATSSSSSGAGTSSRRLLMSAVGEGRQARAENALHEYFTFLPSSAFHPLELHYSAFLHNPFHSATQRRRLQEGGANPDAAVTVLVDAGAQVQALSDQASAIKNAALESYVALNVYVHISFCIRYPVSLN